MELSASVAEYGDIDKCQTTPKPVSVRACINPRFFAGPNDLMPAI